MRPTSEDILNANGKYFAHKGASMNPTLSAGDLLEVRPLSSEMASAGDVIVFVSPDADSMVVHRIVKMTAKGIVTRGDNCLENDSWFVQPEWIQGKVYSFWRAGKKRMVVGGRRGFLTASLRWKSRPVRQRFCSPLKPLYHFLAQWNVFTRMLPERLKPKVIVFSRGRDTWKILVLGKLIIATFNENHGQWLIRRPFRLFVSAVLLKKQPNGYTTNIHHL